MITDRRSISVYVTMGGINCKLTQVNIPSSAQAGKWYPFIIRAKVLSGNNFTGVLAIKNNGNNTFSVRVGDETWEVSPRTTWKMPVPVTGGVGSYFWVEGHIMFPKAGTYQLEVECGYE